MNHLVYWTDATGTVLHFRMGCRTGSQPLLGQPAHEVVPQLANMLNATSTEYLARTPNTTAPDNRALNNTTCILTPLDQLQAWPKSKGELAEALYGHFTYDCALPQAWVDELRERGFDHAQVHFVWGYPTDATYGVPLPVTAEGLRILACLGAAIS